MAFKIVNQQLKYTGTIEESIVEALIKYPGLKVLVTTEKKNAIDAAISFYINVNTELKDKYLMDTDGISTKYSNDSEITFIGNTRLVDGKYDNIDSHILLAYGNLSDWQLTKLLGALMPYKVTGTKMFPIIFTEAYQLFGEEAEKFAAECKEEYIKNATGVHGRKKKIQ